MLNLQLFIYRNLHKILLLMFGIFAVINIVANNPNFIFNPIHAMEGTQEDIITSGIPMLKLEDIPQGAQLVENNIDIQNLTKDLAKFIYDEGSKVKEGRVLWYIVNHSAYENIYNSIPKNSEIYYKLTPVNEIIGGDPSLILSTKIYLQFGYTLNPQ